MSPRPHCQVCNRPQKTCLCDVIVKCRSKINVVILQDPKESRHALSSAPLLHRCIEDSRLIVGEHFEPREILGPDWRRQCLLVFPGDHAISPEQAKQGTFSQLLLIDGSWRKVARLFHLNPWLNDLPRIAIHPAAPSNYRIRKSPRSDGLSTLEAAVSALNILDEDTDYGVILPAFTRMIDLQINAMGKATYTRNYHK